MNFWQQFALMQASSALHAVIRLYGAKYFTPEELAASDMVLDAVTALPERIQTAATPPPNKLLASRTDSK